VLQDDTTQNNQCLIEIQKFNNKIILPAKVLQWALRPPFRNEAARYVRCCSRVKKSLARQKRLRSQAWPQFVPVLRGETPAIHVMFWRNTTKNSCATYYLIFLRFRGWRTMRGHRSHSLLLVDVTK
jgi:hypothetical protein